MGRWSNYPDIVEETRCLCLKELLGYGYFQYDKKVSGVLTWSSGAAISLISHSQTRLDLSYTITRTNEEVKYSVRLVLRPSNLGVGEILFFVCPNSLKACRKLYLPSSQRYFLSRQAFPNLYYDSQLANKRLRVFDKMFRNERKIEELYKAGFRPYYNGKKTRKHLLIDKYSKKGFSPQEVRELAMLKI